MTDPVACPHCGKGLKPLAHLVGQAVVCPACRESFTLSPAPAPAPPPPRPEPLPDDALTTRPESSPLLTPRAPPPTHPEASGTPAVGPFRLRFQARVVRDPRRELAGVYDATLADSGLRLQNDEQDVLLDRGLPARHEGDNRIVVKFDGRELELALERKGWATERLAPDVAAFLNREVRHLRESDYCTPLSLCLMALLPVGIPVVTAGGLAWGMLAAVLVGLCLALIMANSLSRGTRLLGVLVLSGFGYLTIFTFHPTLSWGRHEIEPSAWRRFAPQDAPFEVEVPGEPRRTTRPEQELPSFEVERATEELTFNVSYRPIDLRLRLIPRDQLLDLLQPVLSAGAKPGTKAQRLMLHGCPALDYDYEKPKGGKKRHYRSRLVIVGDTAIALSVEGPRARYEKDVRRFLDSFRPRRVP